ncbi:MAG TPA: metal-dependent hydrolase [Acidimicrobiales bacterium]|nr:metal-dependent hydrolase [Acidimicrobiales bacterium]
MARVENDASGVPTRPLEFNDCFDDLPKHFAIDGDIVMSHVLAVLSSVFPDGEDYFVRAVQRVQARITHPALRADVDGFVGQESMHGREHRVLNDRLAELGYPSRAIGSYVRWLFRNRERIRNERLHLGFTAALEHYTATLAETLLELPEARAEVGHPAVQSLLMWHALEESEHKAVAFDVYRAVGGTERMRIATMWITHALFLVETGLWTLISLAMDDDARRHPAIVARSLWRLRRSPFTSKRAVRQLLEYTRPGFHPNQRDTTELIAEWRTILFGSRGELASLVAG